MVLYNMTPVHRKDLMNELFDALLYTAAGVGVSMASKKLLGEPLTKEESIKDIVKLTVAIGSGVLITKYLQQKSTFQLTHSSQLKKK